MRRTTPRALEIGVAARVTARQLEAWSNQKLGPNQSLTREREIAHYRALAQVVRPGRGNSPDRAALRLATRGFACERLRGALIRTANVPATTDPAGPLDLADDAIFSALEAMTVELVRQIDALPLPTRSIMRGLMRNLRPADCADDRSPEEVLVAAFVNVLCLLLGGDMYDLEPLAVLVGVPTAEVDADAVEFINDCCRVTFADIDESFRSANLQVIVLIARWLRTQVDRVAADQLADLGISAEALDELAALSAPFVIAITNQIMSSPKGAALMRAGGWPIELFSSGMRQSA